ncbi:MAG: biotin--[acetyl-CoA-carboxylase] ligase [Sporomusaceae bacterium]|jgi:BirA family biotin operon repressor/biotin-[acetyl-CoA-carboxylase] ligase|nr:biotin--[acetyl-CoA-carboxylase] ligase [Sporomusaceae bacterium]
MLKNKILALLEEQKGNIVTGGQLAHLLGVSRTAVWKSVRALQEAGNEIVSIPNSGYRLLATNDTLLEASIREKLTAKFIASELKLFPSLPSTNKYLKETDTSHLPSGYAVIADEQTQGRGRRDRSFLSPKREGLYLSILLKLDASKQDIRLLTICAAVAVSQALEAVCRLKAEIKWVNDIYCQGKKICGILTEATFSGELQELSDVIVGIGINTGTVPKEISALATSVQEVTGRRGIRNQLAAEVLNQFETVCLDYFANNNRAEIIAAYASRLFITGRQVLVSGQKNAVTVAGISAAGALLVTNEQGETEEITTGEIKLV